MSNIYNYQRNRDVILNRIKYYHENNKEKLKKHARDKYRNLSEEEKNKKKNMRKTRYHNVSEKREKTKTKGMSKNLS